MAVLRKSFQAGSRQSKGARGASEGPQSGFSGKSVSGSLGKDLPGFSLLCLSSHLSRLPLTLSTLGHTKATILPRDLAS